MTDNGVLGLVFAIGVCLYMIGDQFQVDIEEGLEGCVPTTQFVVVTGNPDLAVVYDCSEREKQ